MFKNSCGVNIKMLRSKDSVINKTAVLNKMLRSIEQHVMWTTVQADPFQIGRETISKFD